MILSLSLNLHFSYDVVLVWASLGSSCFGPLLFLDFYVYFLHQVREISCHYFFKYVFNFLLSLFSFWLPYDVNIGMLKVVLEAPSVIFIFIILFLFVCCSDWVFFAPCITNCWFDSLLHLFYCRFPINYSSFQSVYDSFLTGFILNFWLVIFYVFLNMVFMFFFMFLKISLSLSTHPLSLLSILLCFELCI